MKWIVIEDFAPTEKYWIQLAYRNIDNIREYRFMANLNGVEVDAPYRNGTSEENKKQGYAQYWKAEDFVIKQY
jgi:hypothetical protein